MVTAHRSNPEYADIDMSGTFALAATGNGIVAILAGILAQYSAGKLSIRQFLNIRVDICIFGVNVL